MQIWKAITSKVLVSKISGLKTITLLKISNFINTTFRNANLQNPDKNHQIFFCFEILKTQENQFLRTAMVQSG